MNIKQIHREAMVFAQEAHLLQQNGDFEKSIELFEKAFELEQQAALFYLNQDKEPTRSILFKSAAALANNCKRYRDAEKMIGFALSGNPPIEIADEIRNLYENINFYRHLELRDVVNFKQMKDKKVFKAVLEALVLADIQVSYKLSQNLERSKPERLTEKLKNELVKAYNSVEAVSILYNNGRQATLLLHLTLGI